MISHIARKAKVRILSLLSRRAGDLEIGFLPDRRGKGMDKFRKNHRAPRLDDGGRIGPARSNHGPGRIYCSLEMVSLSFSLKEPNQCIFFVSSRADTELSV